jgi:hypothetical protein
LIHTDELAQANSQIVFLEAQIDMTVEEVAGKHLVLEAIGRLLLAFDIHIIQHAQEVGHP